MVITMANVGFLAQRFMRRRLKCENLTDKMMDVKWWQKLIMAFKAGEVNKTKNYTNQSVNASISRK